MTIDDFYEQIVKMQDHIGQIVTTWSLPQGIHIILILPFDSYWNPTFSAFATLFSSINSDQFVAFFVLENYLINGSECHFFHCGSEIKTVWSLLSWTLCTFHISHVLILQPSLRG